MNYEVAMYLRWQSHSPPFPFRTLPADFFRPTPTPISLL